MKKLSFLLLLLCSSWQIASAQINPNADCDEITDIMLSAYPCLEEQFQSQEELCSEFAFILTDSIGIENIQEIFGDMCGDWGNPIDTTVVIDPVFPEFDCDEIVDIVLSTYPCLQNEFPTDQDLCDAFGSILTDSLGFENIEEILGDICGDGTGQPTLEEEFDYYTSVYPECLAGFSASDFDSVEALDTFTAENCEEETNYPFYDCDEFIGIILEIYPCMVDEFATEEEICAAFVPFILNDSLDSISGIFGDLCGNWGEPTDTTIVVVDPVVDYDCDEVAEVILETYPCLEGEFQSQEELCEAFGAIVTDSLGIENIEAILGDICGDGTGQTAVEEEFAYWNGVYPNCMGGVSPEDFASVEEIYDFLFGENGCANQQVDYDCDLITDIMLSAYPCLEEQFQSQEELCNEFAFILTDSLGIENIQEIFGDICGDGTGQPTIEEEFAQLQEYYGECLSNYTADDFASIEELYNFVEINCYDEPTPPTVEEEFWFFASLFPDCLANQSSSDFANLGELYNFVEENCIEAGFPTDTTNITNDGWENGWDMPENIEDWMEDCYPDFGIDDIDFNNDGDIFGFTTENGVTIEWDENGAIISVDGLGANNLPADVIDYLIENAYNDDIEAVWVETDDEGNVIIIVLVNIGGGKNAGQMELRFDVNGNFLSSESVEATAIASITDTSIETFPNPATDFVNIQANNIIELVELTNINGQTLVRFAPAATETQVSMRNIPMGIYILQVQTTEGIQTQRIVKK